MQCPECSKNISNVRVFSECYQMGSLEGKRIVDYGCVEEILNTLAIECPECGADLKGVVEEG